MLWVTYGVLPWADMNAATPPGSRRRSALCAASGSASASTPPKGQHTRVRALERHVAHLGEQLAAARYAPRAVQFHPQWGPIRFRPLVCTHTPWGVRVGELAKPRTIPTRKGLPHFCWTRSGTGHQAVRRSMDEAKEYAPRAVQFHPHGGQPDFDSVWLSARAPHRGAWYVWRA